MAFPAGPSGKAFEATTKEPLHKIKESGRRPVVGEQPRSVLSRRGDETGPAQVARRAGPKGN